MSISHKSVFLMYHDIHDGIPQPNAPRSASMYHVPKTLFERHLQVLRSSQKSILSLGEFLAGKAAESVVLTFDDGWAGAFRIAVPLLREFGLRATFFLTRDFVNHRGFCDHRMIMEAADNAIEFGIHGTTHRLLSGLPYPQLVLEFSECKNYLESLLGNRVAYASLPGGDVNADVVRAAQQVGLQCICGSVPGINTDRTSPFRLKRVPIRAITTPSQIQDYCKYRVGKETGRWFMLHAPKKLLGMRNYARIRRFVLDRGQLGNPELFDL